MNRLPLKTGPIVICGVCTHTADMTDWPGQGQVSPIRTTKHKELPTYHTITFLTSLYQLQTCQSVNLQLMLMLMFVTFVVARQVYLQSSKILLLVEKDSLQNQSNGSSGSQTGHQEQPGWQVEWQAVSESCWSSHVNQSIGLYLHSICYIQNCL